MSNTTRFAVYGLFSFLPVVVAAGPARAGVYELAAAGVITSNTSGNLTIPVGTPWVFELRYDTAAPDLDFEAVGSVDPTYGVFKNTAVPPALRSFHYRAGSYEVLLDDPADFGEFSDVLVTFTGIHAIDINVRSPGLFPLYAGGPVSFHADFNAFQSAPVLSTDGLPTSAGLGPASFDASTVSLLPQQGTISGTTITKFAIREVPEPGAGVLAVMGAVMAGSWRRRRVSSWSGAGQAADRRTLT